MSLVDKINDTLIKHEKTLFMVSMLLALITIILLFDVKVSLSGDDCDYIVAAGDFWKRFTYPTHHGPLYPIVISPIIGLFGVNLILLKSLSVVFMMGALWLFYQAFRRLVPAIVLIPAFLLVCINPYVLFFSSYTYSEPLFLLMEGLFFYLFSKYFWKSDQMYTLKKDWGKYLILALVIIGMGLTRTIGFCVVGVIILYFCIERRWKDLLYITGSFIILFCLFYFSKPLIWPNSGSVQSFEALFAKNTYNPEQGMEDLPGMIRRVVANSHIYLSGFLYKYFGFRSSSDLPLEDIPVLSLLTYVLYAICLVFVFKKNKPLLFAGLYAGILIFASFVLLHIMWAQDRIIMVYYPYALLFLLGGLYFLFSSKAFRKVSFMYLLVLASLLIGTGTHAKNRIGQHIAVLQQNLSGNSLYGLTPDWENFIKMCRWANDNLEKDAVIVSRKPSISYVYTGRDFQGLYNVPYVNIQEVANQYQAEKERYTFLTIDMTKQNSLSNELTPFLQYVIVSKKGGSFQINHNNISSALVFRIEKSYMTEEFLQFLSENELNYTLDYEPFIKQYIDDNLIRYQIINPDVLYKNLIDLNVKYLILAKIRLYTAQNTGLFINTIHQYANFIHFKYPNRFQLIHSIGKEETCDLVEFLRE